ncbi:disco-interacting protein 2-like [Rhagoletis pomonella]|uniref:disco-interacting protein 2-like n=1 Tax=Rhagoletis pomonella TaxID=28610 RepID=UPI001784361E|nr:disco-interacting protein 2-like [Rhagoletis pomonella]XP_036346289.1 disco-interacting protein 2-like [Rhagoletis pomonella]XP_036346290.1 disco-interacting protein 2-like [Rhagoletis pomonella]XP_036346291.1 disco-interacting protein 2-like [Rhagoletis pomonella]
MSANLMENLAALPADVREKLAELDLELSEGDITQKGYEKKRAKLLQPFLIPTTEGNDSKLDKCDKPIPPYYNIKTPQQPQNPKTVKDGALVSSEGYSYVTEVPSLPSSHQRHSNASKKSDHSVSGGGSGGGGGGGGGSGSGGHIERSESSHQHSRQRRTQRKITHNEKRYHSEVRQEAVQQALAALKTRPKPSLPMPSKRSSVLNRSPDRNNDDIDSSTDEESIPEETISPDKEYNYPRDHVSNIMEPIIKPPIRDSSMGGAQNKHKYPERRPPQNLPPLVRVFCTYI